MLHRRRLPLTLKFIMLFLPFWSSSTFSLAMDIQHESIQTLNSMLFMCTLKSVYLRVHPSFFPSILSLYPLAFLWEILCSCLHQQLIFLQGNQVTAFKSKPATWPQRPTAGKPNTKTPKPICLRSRQAPFPESLVNPPLSDCSHILTNYPKNDGKDS